MAKMLCLCLILSLLNDVHTAYTETYQAEGLFFTRKAVVLDNTQTWTIVVSRKFDKLRQHHEELLRTLAEVQSLTGNQTSIVQSLQSATVAAMEASKQARRDFETSIATTQVKSKRFIIPLITSIIGFIAGLIHGSDHGHIQKALDAHSGIIEGNTHLVKSSVSILSDLGNRQAQLDSKIERIKNVTRVLYNSQIILEVKLQKLAEEQILSATYSFLLAEFKEIAMEFHLLINNIFEATSP